MARLLPDYADRFFDNVGGEILDNMLTMVERHGMITVCGAIAGSWFSVHEPTLILNRIQ